MPTRANAPADFPPESFALIAFCDACGHQAALARDRLPPGVPVQGLTRRLRCGRCQSRDCSLRIVYTGARATRRPEAAAMPE